MTPPARTSSAPAPRVAGRLLWSGLALGWAALVWVVLTWPPPAEAPELGAWLPWPLEAIADKAGHALLFLVQTLLVHRALRGEGGSRGGALALAALLALAYGGATELRQRTVEGRSADPWDFAADGAGSLAYAAGLRFSGARRGAASELRVHRAERRAGGVGGG